MMVAMESFSPPISMQECGVHVHICMLDVWESVPVPVCVCTGEPEVDVGSILFRLAGLSVKARACC